MLLSIPESAADTHYEYRPVFPGNPVFPLLWGQSRITLPQLFRMDEQQAVFRWQHGGYPGIHFADHVFRPYQRCIDAPDNPFEKGYVPVTGGNDTLPVPLVHIQGMQVPQILIRTDGIHVGIDTVSRLYPVFGKGKPFPLGKRMHHFRLRFIHILYPERHGPLHSVQVIVDAHSLEHEQWGGYPPQPEFR